MKKGALLIGMGLTVTRIEAGTVTLVAASFQCRYRGVTEPPHTCGWPRALKTGDSVLVRKVVADGDPISVSAPCGCTFVLHGREI